MKKQRTEEEMGQVLSAFDGSGQSMREFCAASGMAEHLYPFGQVHPLSVIYYEKGFFITFGDE
jgi:hypothetical protein